MQSRNRKQPILIGLFFVVLFLGVSGSQATGTGRIYEYRETVKANLDVINVPNYVSGVQYLDLLDHPTVHQLFSWAKDNEAWTAALLETFRQSSAEVEEIEEFLGDKVLFVFIDFTSTVGGINTPYAATINLETGEVLAEYEDCKTEIWADVEFVQELIRYGDNYAEEEVVPFAVNRYYEDWGIWVERGPFDLMMTQDMLWIFIAWEGILGGGYGVYRWKKGK